MFLIVLINLYRIIFLYVFSEQLVAVNWQEIVNCLWLGFRLSLKTAGLLALIGFVFSALPQILIGKWLARVICKSFAYKRINKAHKISFTKQDLEKVLMF